MTIMTFAVLCSATGLALTLVAYGLYSRQIWRRQAAPDKLARLIWMVLTITAVRSSYELSGAIAVATAAGSAAGSTVVTLLALFRSGTLRVTRFTVIMFTFGVLSAAASFASPKLALVLLVAASLSASTLEITKTYLRPATEPLVPWVIATICQVFACAAALVYGFWPAMLPALSVVLSAAMCAAIRWSPHRSSHPGVAVS